ncbi:MAG TPA: patatin-like phospholipase family protein [Steroidobacteraceae bacterium]|nr:patatin-like phospholipase family protein [Steroidobacteraceae bacterium]
MDGDPGETLVLRGDPLALLESSPIFRGLDRPTLSAISAELESLSLPGGATLFEAGEAPDAMYLLIAGCLGAYSGGEAPRLLGRITAGETVGEMGLLSGHPRSATVRALRDSDLARLPRESFDRVILRHPAAMLRVAQLVVERLESSERGAGHAGTRTFTVLPQSIEVDVGGFATELVAALGGHGRAELVWSVRGADHTSAWFHRIESANDYVVYVADPGPTSWSKLCVRQADSLLFVARAEAAAAPWPLAAGDLGRGSVSARAELVLLHDERIEAGAAARWCAQMPAVPHHHVRGAPDVARVARLLTGQAVGLVLSGGGARGFAHIGVVRALREAGVAIDLVGGTSMGAIMGAGVAAGWTTEEMVERFHRTFVATNPLNDYTLPIVSLVAGRKVSRLLRQEFGATAIEDLPLPFYAVSANLTTGRGSVHRAGELWRWLRASVAIPGVLPPVFHHGEVHVDGGAINNMPVDVMRAFHPGVVIGVDVGSDTTFTSDIQDVDLPPLWKLLGWFRRHKQRPTILQILWRAGMVNSDAATAAGRRLTDLLLQPPLADIDLLSWRSFGRAIEAGYRHAHERLAALDAAGRARLGLAPR